MIEPPNSVDMEIIEVNQWDRLVGYVWYKGRKIRVGERTYTIQIPTFSLSAKFPEDYK